MSTIRLSLFGVPHLERDAETLPIPRRKTMALLAYLAVTGSPHSREALATLFWPEHDQSSALANLRREISRLKEVLGEQILVADRLQVGLNQGGGLWLDIVAFQAKLKAALDQAPADECLEALRSAADIYQSDFMSGFTLPDTPRFDEWQFFQAEELRRSLADALRRLIELHTSHGEFTQAIPYARRWLSQDPLHEPAHRQLMQLYTWSGQQSAALRQYQEYQRILQEELGVEPDQDTQALYQAIKSRQLPPPRVGETPQALYQPATSLAPQERYVQDELLAIGGQGEIYRGKDLATGQPVVIKHLRAELIQRDPHSVERFVREGEALRQLDHPNIVKLLDMSEERGEYRLIMEYIPGGSLRSALDKHPQLPVEQVIDIALELADALSRAHHLNIIHRDLKPDNVLLAEDGTPRLTDFGVARLVQENAKLTQTGVVLGSPAYLSPEALRSEALDARSDIWSFGVMLYEMLAGRLPYDGDQITSVLVGILQAPVPDIERFRPDVPPPLADLIRRMLVKDRENRISSMRQVAAGLETIRSGRKLESSQSDMEGQIQPAGTPAGLSQTIRFCTSPDGVRIAYAVVGEGPVLVKTANWLSHLEYDWKSPVWRHWLNGLASKRTLVRYDERGCGLSDWNVKDFSLDAWVLDLETVVDALGLERFPLLGISQGASIAVTYAVRHPEKVSHLILYGGYLRGRFHRDLTPKQREELDVMIQLIKIGWGQEHPAFRQVFSMFFLPEGTPEQLHAFSELERITTTPEIAARIVSGFQDIDVRELARQVTQPTLVLHAKDELRVPFEEGRLMAAMIPNARLVPLESKNHILLEHEPAWRRFQDEVNAFLAE